jgi:hypothetical protein
LKGRRDKIPALRRKGSSGGEKPGKISHFLFGLEYRNYYLCRPKSKKKPLLIQCFGGQWFFEIMK